MVDPGAPRLRGIEILSSLSDAELLDLDRRCRWQRHAAGQQIIDRASVDRDVFFVVEGRVQAIDYTLTGREVVFALIGPGSHFGELSAIDGRTRTASVVAVEACLLAALPPSAFESLILMHPEVSLALLRQLVSMVRTTDERLIDLATLGAMARVCRELLRLATPDDATGLAVITPLPTQKDLAGRTGTTRETVARTLAQLARDDLVQRAGRTLRILDRAGLQAAIDGLGAGPPGR